MSVPPDLSRCAAATDVQGACAGLVDDLFDGTVLPAVYLLEDGRLRCRATRGYFQVSDFASPHGVVARAVREGRPVVLQDVRLDEGYVAGLPDLQAEACFPVRLDGKVVGALNVESRSRLGDQCLEDAGGAAVLLGERLRELGGLPPPSLPERLARVAVTMTSLTRPERVRAQAAEAARAVSGAAGAAVAARGPDGRWRVEHAEGPLAEVLRHWDDEVLRFLGGWVWAGAGSSFPDGEAVPEAYRFLEGRVRALWVHSLVVAGEVTGLLLTADDRQRPHDPSVSAGLELLASLAAGALTVIGTMDRLRDEAACDALTGLVNRRGLVDVLGTASRSGSGALVLLDLDGFKAVNDRFGHGAGDDVLRAVAAGLRAVSHDGDVVCRLGGDEFAVLVGDLDTVEQARVAGDSLVVAAAAAATSVGRCTVGASAGVRLVSGAAREALLPEADVALMAAKRDGGARTVVWDAALQAQRSDAEELVRDLDAALVDDDGSLQMAYQPIVDLGTSRVLGVEALLRWTHPVRGPLPATAVIARAEQAGKMAALTRWVLRTALTAAAGWPTGPEGRGVNLGVNLSAASLSDERVVDDVQQALTASGLEPGRLVLEMTETAQVRDLPRAAQVLGALSRLGVVLALDDFGTGYSSLTHVHALPFHVLKVDRSFVTAAAAGDVKAQATVAAVCTLAERLGVDVVAEGIEHPEQVAGLLALGCRHGQGYAYARPMAGSALADALRAHQRTGWVLLPGAGV